MNDPCNEIEILKRDIEGLLTTVTVTVSRAPLLKPYQGLPLEDKSFKIQIKILKIPEYVIKEPETFRNELNFGQGEQPPGNWYEFDPF